jgi:hypothetical protein
MSSVNIVLFTKYYNDDQIKEDRVGGPCRAHRSGVE